MSNSLFKNALPAVLFAVVAMSASAHAQYRAPQSAVSVTTPSRDEVRNDLLAWKQSGLAQAWHTENTPNIEGPEYRAMYRDYIELSAKQIGGMSDNQPPRQPR